MKAPDTREKLKSYPDFQNAATLLEDLVHSRGHLCVFYPKYHWSQKGLTALPWNRSRNFSDYVGTMNVFVERDSQGKLLKKELRCMSHRRVTVD